MAGEKQAYLEAMGATPVAAQSKIAASGPKKQSTMQYIMALLRAKPGQMKLRTTNRKALDELEALEPGTTQGR